MIIHKPKNKVKKQFPYLYFLMLLLIGAFAVLVMYSGQTTETPTLDAQAPVITAADPVNLSGEWVGTGTEDYGVENRYDLRLTIAQDGNTIQGVQYMETSNNEPEIYAISSISGSVSGDSFNYVEGQLLELDNIAPSNWCFAAVTLTYENVGGQDTLIGTWSNGEPDRAECNGITGRVILTRQPK